MAPSSSARRRPLTGTDIRVNPESEIPLHRQLIEQIIVLISTGKWKPQASIPTVRQLARQKQIHYNTISRAYRDLVKQGWLMRSPGKALTVCSLDGRNSPVQDLDDLIDVTIRMARDYGFSIEQLRGRVYERLAMQLPDHLLVVSADAGMRQLMKVELEAQVSFPVRECSQHDLISNNEPALGALIVCLPGV
jgi:DNA-binding transcriptional regulator YhcF (GntR family)